MQKITLIAAIDTLFCLGKDNKMLWHLPEDFRFFKAYTTDKPIVMGRKTWDSLPKKPLPQRANLVLTHQTDWQESGATVFHDIKDVLTQFAHAPEIVIIGGAEIYQQFLPFATDLRLTELHHQAPAGDAHFPNFDRQQWQEISRKTQTSTHQNIKFDFVHYQKQIVA